MPPKPKPKQGQDSVVAGVTSPSLSSVPDNSSIHSIADNYLAANSDHIPHPITKPLSYSQAASIQGTAQLSTNSPNRSSSSNQTPKKMSTTRGSSGGKAKVPPTMHGRPPLLIGEPPGSPSSHSKSTTPLPNEHGRQDEEMNAHLSEKIRKGATKTLKSWEQGQEEQALPPHPRLTMFEQEVPDPISPWRVKPEIPTVQDLLRTDVEIPPNRIQGKWRSVEEYLGSHYELLREDAYATLRDATLSVRVSPDMDDEADICIYENVRIIGYTFSDFGVGVKCSFSLNRAKKKVRWSYSKRLIPGTLVCLSWDEFKDEKNMRLATVLARPIPNLSDGPLAIDLLFADDGIEIDSFKQWIMVESRGSYFEAYKHTLKALQKMKPSNFPLHEHLVSLEPEIPPPDYIKENPIFDLSPVFPDEPSDSEVKNVDVLGEWPKVKETSMDQNQLSALRRMITRRLAIVQGPPGTGKTYTSVLALKALIGNMKPDDPPIIVSCQTNHALDQILLKILEFEPEVVRLGGRTQEPEIKKRTLNELRSNSSINIRGSAHKRAKAEMSRLERRMITLLEDFKDDLISPRILRELGIISDGQFNAFTKRSKEWVSARDDSKPVGEMATWLDGYIDQIHTRENIYSEEEDPDANEETVDDMNAEFLGNEFELRGNFVAFHKSYVVAESKGVDRRVIQEHLKNNKVWEWESHVRAAVYKLWETRALNIVLDKFRLLNQSYARAVRDYKIAKWHKDVYLIETKKIVGLTNTGLAKYRSLVASASPRIVMIEEAAESLEGPIITACFPTVQHLILVGDHQQLRPHCNSRELAVKPFFLGISMFERLVDNEMGFDKLKVQWRMRPEIRRLLEPIYNDLEDHPTVMGRPHVPGMGDVDVFFYWHDYNESQDDGTSLLNTREAEMIVNFTVYLYFNGVPLENITILTFYSGQRNCIAKMIRKDIDLNKYAASIKVTTVDSYQGEENEVILLSLVRSNRQNRIGFLKTHNRVCVSMSRARQGFYIFGNGQMITGVNELWWEICRILHTPESKKIGFSLPITCTNHSTKLEIKEISEWLDNKGGCNKICGQQKPCSHICQLKCHPYDHERVFCFEACNRILPCCGGHCLRRCGEECSCRVCNPQLKSGLLDGSDSLLVENSSSSRQLMSGDQGGRRMETDTPVRTRKTFVHTFMDGHELPREQIANTKAGASTPGNSITRVQKKAALPVEEVTLIDLDEGTAPPSFPTEAPGPGWNWVE